MTENPYIERSLIFLHCPSLSSLYLSTVSFPQLNLLVAFLDRNGSFLTEMSLGIYDSESEGEDINEAIVNNLRLVPSLTVLRLRFDHSIIISTILSALSQRLEQTFDIVPRLTHLVLEMGKAACTDFSSLVTARWNVPPNYQQYLRSAELCSCYDIRPGTSRIVDLPSFHGRYMGVKKWKHVKACVDEGLNFCAF